MKIAYVGPFSFPGSHANALRVRGVASALAGSGHSVVIGSMQAPPPQVPGVGAIPGVEVAYLSEYESGVFSRLSAGVRGFLLGDRTAAWIRDMPEKPDVVILYGVHLGYLARLIYICRKLGITLILDVVEWYRARDLPGGRFGPFAVANEFCMRMLATKVDGIFAISRFLELHFSRKGCRVHRLPPVFDKVAVLRKPAAKSRGALKVCYVGSPGSKEALEVIFAGLREARTTSDIQLHFIGAKLEELRSSLSPRLYSYLLAAESDTFFHGRLDNEAAQLVSSSCDFSVVVRKRHAFVEAGFPFKVAESLVNGVPLICNIFSDLGAYVQNGREAVIVDDVSASAVAKALRYAASLSQDQLGRMGASARATGASNFVAESQAPKLSSFLESVVNTHSDSNR